MDGTYNYYIVALSILIAIFASYSAINIASKLTIAHNKNKIFWLLAGAIVLGSGVWSMHFIGMLAFHTGMEMHYDPKLTVFSMLASVGAAFIAFLVTMPTEVKGNRIIFGAFILGSGIITMHYVGMKAMVVEGSLSYNPSWFIISVLIAYTASYVALFLFIRFRKDQTTSGLKILSAIAMGIAICGMHYTGMKATIFPEAHSPDGDFTNNQFLLYAATITVGIILFVTWLIFFVERQVLQNMAYEDTLTGLPNRNAMNRFLDNYRKKNEITILLMDLDQFKFVNDSLGHDSGDLLIKQVGERLTSFNAKDQQVYRIGGDEFLLTIKSNDVKRAVKTAEEILQTIVKVYQIGESEVHTTTSIGISIGYVTNDGQDLMKTADTALYTAKKQGKNRYCLYDEKMGEIEERRMLLEKDLSFAVENEELFIEYQPKWNIELNKLHGFEALLRWKHPELGLISPGEFIPIAEESGSIIPITRWVLEKSATQCAIWEEQGINQPISANLSARLFHTDNLVEQMEEIIEKVNVSPHLLELEITESLVLTNIDTVFEQLQRLRAIGVRISLDDFGSGYSSIGLLDQIPLDTIKLDRLFMNDLETTSKQAIIKAIIIMAEQLGLDVIAEGIENKMQVNFLKDLGCHVIQGFYFGKPMGVVQAEEWMKQASESNKIG
ncbi:bifunctional diguanylate cyclase/phosphodiesterase [Oceanobacillus sp. CAU 1775]